MAVLLWLLIPVAGLVIGMIWVYLTTRPPRPAAMQESMESFSRFRRALAIAAVEPRNVAARRKARALRNARRADGADES